MKKLFSLLLLIVCVQSCVIRVINEPNRPPCPPPGGQPWWYSQSTQPNDTRDTTNITNKNTDNKQRPVEPNAEDTVQVSIQPVPTTKYDSATIDGILTFNVYLGWSIDEMEAIVLLRDFPKEGGEVIFNIYTNNMSMSMYGFQKYYATDFYWFSDEPPYCGYASYSLDTKSICRYKMVIRENDTNSDRFCNGYWSCNNASGFYSSFKLILYQRF